jgi:hypothetical protein
MSVDARARASLLLQEVLHPVEMDRFSAACVPTSAEELPGLRLRVASHLAWVRAQSAAYPAVDVDTASQLATTLGHLLDEPDVYDAEARALLRGAVHYFVMRDDGEDDLRSPIGFDDDARVVNAVLDALGRTDLRVESI